MQQKNYISVEISTNSKLKRQCLRLQLKNYIYIFEIRNRVLISQICKELKKKNQIHAIVKVDDDHCSPKSVH